MTLHTVTRHPRNAEASLDSLSRSVMPVEDFYVRNNFPAPSLDTDRWRLRITGTVDAPAVFSLQELKRLPVTTRRITLECAGNGRQQVEPTPPGTPWGLGAAGTAEFTGVRLADVLTPVGIRRKSVECVFSGADAGMVEEGHTVRFQRSLPLTIATSPEPILAWAMNGEPLTRDHGHPLRLVVPRWYAVASVKWLEEIEVVDRPFQGYFQADRYVYRRDGAPDEPVTTMRVRSLITSHRDGETVAAGEVVVEGVAWSGEAPIARVQVQCGDGGWRNAEVEPGGAAGVAVPWRVRCPLSAGEHELRARATDATGATQPSESEWNDLGYGNNGVHRVRVTAS